MPTIIHLSDIWEHTLTEILNHHPKTEVGIIMRAWVKHNKLEDFNSLLNSNVDGFPPSGTLCYFKDKDDSEAVMMMPTTPLKELYNLRWYIQYLIDGCESGDDDDVDNPQNKDIWFFQTRRKFMKYVIYNGKAWTHKLVDESAVRPLTKANPNHRLDKDGGESRTPTGLSEGSISGTPPGSSEGSIWMKTPKDPTVFIRSRQDDEDSSAVNPMFEFEPPQENGSR